MTPTSCVCRTEEGRLVDGESPLAVFPFKVVKEALLVTVD